MADEAIPLFAGIVLLLAVSGSLYYLTNVDTTYYCQDKNIVTMCFKLSSQVNGLSSRCYYNETTPTKYFSCSSGWKPIKDFPEIMNNLTARGNEIVEASYSDSLLSDMSQFVKEGFNPEYGVITLTGTKTGKIAEYSLTTTKEGVVSISMEGRSTLYQNGTLFDGVTFNGIAIGDYSIKVVKDNYVDVPNGYEEVCHIENETNVCNNENLYKKENQPIMVWEKYNNQNLTAGNYIWKWEGRRVKNQPVDVIPIKSNAELKEWVWYNSSFNSRMQLNITGGAATLTNFKVFVKLSKSIYMNANYTDVRFVNSSESGEFSYEMDYQNETDAGFWVLIPTLATGVNSIYAYWNNPTATSISSGINTFNEATLQGTWHLGSTLDSKGIYNLTAQGSPTIVSGAFGDAMNYTTNNRHVALMGSATNWGTGNFTMTFWVKKCIGASQYEGIASQNSSWGNGVWETYTDSGRYTYGEGGGTQTNIGINLTRYCAWTFIAADRYGGTGHFYIYNGTMVNVNQSHSYNINQNGGLFLGYAVGRNAYWNGLIDEFRIWNAEVKGPAWYARDYQNFNASSIVYGTEELNLALVVTNNLPVNGANLANFNTSAINFSCNTTSVGGANITSVVLNVSNGSISWTQTITGLNQPNYNASFSNSTILTGAYNWNCIAYGDLTNGTSLIRLFNKYFLMRGKVVNSAGTEIQNANVVVILSNGSSLGNATTNSSGDWFFDQGITRYTNLTVVGYNPNNISQGGNAYPFINL